MSIKNSGGQAFPKAGLDPWNKAQCEHAGMTMRDYFAAKALAGMLADPIVKLGGAGTRNVAALAYEVADAMLAERAE